MTTSSDAYRPDIDGLRAVSIISVLLYHAKLGAPGGYVGVDVFFVISGFLITRLIYKDLDRDKFSLAEFWERRIRRIAPALTAMMIFVMVAVLFILLPQNLVQFGRSVKSQVLFTANHFFQRNTGGYFAGPSHQQPLLHTWSLAVEEQFYLLFPVFLYVFRRYSRSFVSGILLSIGLCSFVLSAYGVYHFPGHTFFLLPTRAWELIIGCLLAMAPANWTLRPLWREVISAGGLVLIVYAACFYNDNTLFPGMRALLPVGGAAAFIAANTGGATIMGRILACKPSVFMGQISYSLYLWHWPLFSLATCCLGELNQLPLTIFLGGLSIVIAILSWRYVEQPWRRRTSTITRNRIFAGFVVVQSVLLLWGTAYEISNGAPSRFPEGTRQVAEDIDNRNKEFDSFIAELEALHPPVVGVERPQAPRFDFAVFGDSHAVALARLFDKVAKQHNLSGALVAQRGKSPLPLSKEIEQRNELFFQFLRREQLKTVVVAARWNGYYGMENEKKGMPAILRAMEAAGVERVFLFRQFPCQSYEDGFSQHLFTSIRFPQWVPAKRISHADYLQARAKEDELFGRLLKATQTMKVEIVDTTAKCFDETGFCRVATAERALYFDDDHVSNFGAEVFLSEKLDELLAKFPVVKK